MQSHSDQHYYAPCLLSQIMASTPDKTRTRWLGQVKQARERQQQFFTIFQSGTKYLCNRLRNAIRKSAASITSASNDTHASQPPTTNAPNHAPLSLPAPPPAGIVNVCPFSKNHLKTLRSFVIRVNQEWGEQISLLRKPSEPGIIPV